MLRRAVLAITALAVLVALPVGAEQLPLPDASDVPLVEVPLEDVPLPEVPLPEVPLPEVPSPEVPLPEVPLPEVPLPEVPLPEVPLPELPDIPGLEELLDDLGSLGDIVGLDPLDPLLAPVLGVVDDLLGAVDDALAASPVPNTLALGGKDAVEAAVALSQATFPDGAGTAVLARDDLFADAFSSGAFQGWSDAPLLFTGRDDLDRRTARELLRLGMDGVTILGGEDALHPLVVSKLESAGLEVIRVGGPTRVETAVETARVTAGDATTALLVRAYPDAGRADDQAYADLLAAGPYAAEHGWPVLLTPSADLHPAVADYLGSSAIRDVVIVGGDGAMAPAVEQALRADGISTRRIAGANRFATAIAIAEERGFSSAADAERLVLAESSSRPDVWAPGFAASSYADRGRAPVILAQGATLPSETLSFVTDGLADNVADGGPVLVCAPFVAPAACEATGLLLLGALTPAVDVLGMTLDQLPGVGRLLEDLDAAGLLPPALHDLLDQLAGVVDGTVGDLLDDLLDAADGVLDDVVGGALDATTGDLLGG